MLLVPTSRLFSGDKLIGGPQAGIIVGRRDLIARIKRHPLTRMLRVDKMTDMALGQTLRLFLDPDRAVREVPTLRMLTASVEELQRRADALKSRVESALLPTQSTADSGTAPAVCSLQMRVTEGHSETGGGSLPATTHSHAVARDPQRCRFGRCNACGPAAPRASGHCPCRP